MTVDVKKARDYVYANGVLWERDLFAWHFQDGSLERLHRSLQAYQNADGGYGNAMEHDVRCPDSHPLALEYLLTVLAQHDVPPGDILNGAAEWVERNRLDDGSLRNPAAVLDYPHAPWWDGGGQSMPDSIVGHLAKYGLASADLLDSTRRWTQQHLTPEHIRANEWLFMAYHAYDWYFNAPDSPDAEACRAAAVENIVACALKMPEDQYYSLLSFVPTPDSPVARALPDGFLKRVLDTLEQAQQPDGSWHDQHGLAQWYPVVTISVLYALRAHGRDIGHL